MITADLDQQLHGGSIDAIDNHDGCIICLQELEKHAVGDDVTTVAIDPLTMSNRHERGVVITVGINDSTGLEILKVIGFCDGDEFTIHDVLRVLSELGELEFTSQFVCDELDHLFHVLFDTGVTNPVARFAVFEDQEEASASIVSHINDCRSTEKFEKVVVISQTIDESMST